MRRVFLLNSGVGPDCLVAALADGLPRDRFAVEVGDLPATRGLDPRPWAALRDAVTAFAPDILHAVGPGAVRSAALLARLSRRRRLAVVASGADRLDPGPKGWLTQLALRSADRVTVRTPAEAVRNRVIGVAADRLIVIPPGVSSPSTSLDPIQFRRHFNIPESGRLIVAAGPFDEAAGVKSAVWAFDVVKYAHPDLYLVLVGDGPERRRIEQFARGLASDDYRVRFTGPLGDLPAVFGLADVAWAMSERGGVQIALGAMAAGVPVVATATPNMSSVVEDGVTGRLAPLTDRVLLARITHELLGNVSEARRLGDAGRDRAAEFTPTRLIERFAALYDDLTTTRP